MNDHVNVTVQHDVVARVPRRAPAVIQQPITDQEMLPREGLLGMYMLSFDQLHLPPSVLQPLILFLFPSKTPLLCYLLLQTHERVNSERILIYISSRVIHLHFKMGWSTAGRVTALAGSVPVPWRWSPQQSPGFQQGVQLSGNCRAPSLDFVGAAGGLAESRASHILPQEHH